MDGSLTKRGEDELERWLEPFLQRLRRKAQRRWAPIYLKGLLLPGERKSVEPMAARVAPADTQQLHHVVAPPRPGRPRLSRTSWSRPPTGWSAGRMRSWSWTTRPW